MKAKANQGSASRSQISERRIITDLRKMGIEEGDHLAVSLSLKSIGYVKGGPEAFIDALLDAVGPNGTIMMNTFTREFPLTWIASDHVFDYQTTPTYTGLVPETFRKRRGSMRSRHPTYSITAMGKLARHLTEDHDQNSSPFLPYTRLTEANGKYLCIGIGNRLVAIRHEAQLQAGLLEVVPFFHGVKYREGKREKIFVHRNVGCVKTLPELVPALRERGVVQVGRIGMAYSVVASARELIDAMTEILKEDPSLNLCDKAFCLWCRELERRMGLYPRIQNPKSFQRNLFMIKIVALLNRVRLKKHSLISFKSLKEIQLIGKAMHSRAASIILDLVTAGYLMLRSYLHV